MRNSKTIILIIFTLLNLVTFQLLRHSAVYSQENQGSKDNMVECYNVAMMPEPAPVKEDLQKRLNTLEKQYKEKKIDKKTYTQTKNNILKQLKELK